MQGGVHKFKIIRELALHIIMILLDVKSLLERWLL